MAEFKAIEDKARTDLYALMDVCFNDGSTVFLSDHPKGDIWSTDVDVKYSKRPHTVAIVRDVIGKKSVGMAALNPPDEFSTVIGRAIALRRAMNKPVPKDYYAAGALLARVTVKLTAPGTPTPSVKAFKVGDTVKLTGKTMPPSNSASAVNPGKTYKITRMDADGKSIQLDGKVCGWVNPVDLVHALIVEAPAAEIRAGDYVRMKSKNFGPSVSSSAKVGGIYKVVKVHPYGGFQLDLPYAPHVNNKDTEKVVCVKLKAQTGGTIRINTTGAFGADVKEGDFFTVTGTSDADNAITGANVNTGEKGGWFIPDEYYEVVEAVNASRPAPEADTTGTIKVGDKVKYVYDAGRVHTVKELTTCGCGKPAILTDYTGRVHIENLTKIEDAPPAVKWVKKEAQVGDTIRRPVGRSWHDTNPYVVKSIGKCGCGARILKLEGSTDTPHPDNYEVLDV
jgi:hypothetical protein